MSRNLALLRAQCESALAGRISAPLEFRERKPCETVSTGVPEVDALAGGLARGGITEICGPVCSGRTSLLLSSLAARTAAGEVCALIDGSDNFDPHSGVAAGIELKRLLWVRCRNIDHALRAADLLIQAGGFGLIALDLSGCAPRTVRQISLNVWFRFRRAIEGTPSIFVLFDQEPNAKTCASLVLRLAAEPICRSAELIRGQAPQQMDLLRHSFAWLLDGFEIRAEVLRSRLVRPAEFSSPESFSSSAEGLSAIFAARMASPCAGLAEKRFRCEPTPASAEKTEKKKPIAIRA